MFSIFKAKNDKYKELGQIKTFASYNYTDETRRALQGMKKFETYKEMSEDDATISGVLYIIKSLLIRAGWNIKPANIDDKQNITDADFIKECLDDMAFTFSDFIDEVLSMLEYGYSYFEIVYKPRDIEASNFKDGKIGWKKFAFRSQDTIIDWNIEQDGGIRGAIQSCENGEVFLPIEKCLLFRTSTRKNNPEGKSLLRGAYKSWYYKTHVEKYEAIGIERDLAGLPKVLAPLEVIAENGEEYDSLKKLASNIKNDEQAGFVIPSDVKDGARMYDVELLTASGSKAFDTDKIITRHDTRIAMTLCADFMLLGQGSTGSWALSTDKTDMFKISLNAITKKIQEVVNKYAIPRLFEINGMEREVYPELIFEPVGDVDLEKMAGLITSLTNAGMPLFPNPEIENSILKVMGFENSATE